jgi:hypothetical protein
MKLIWIIFLFSILPGDLEQLPEEKIRASDGIVRLQSGTNKYDSQKGMTGFGTARRETTKMVRTLFESNLT